MKAKYILLCLIVVFLIIFTLGYVCPFQAILHISCPACGLTRAFRAILHFQFLESLKLNLLGIPLFLFISISFILLIKDMIKKEDKFYYKFINFIYRHYKIILIILIVNMIINNIKFI